MQSQEKNLQVKKILSCGRSLVRKKSVSETRVEEEEEDTGTEILQKMRRDHCSQIAKLEREDGIDSTKSRDDQRTARAFVQMKTAEDE